MSSNSNLVLLVGTHVLLSLLSKAKIPQEDIDIYVQSVTEMLKLMSHGILTCLRSADLSKNFSQLVMPLNIFFNRFLV